MCVCVVWWDVCVCVVMCVCGGWGVCVCVVWWGVREGIVAAHLNTVN